jgi:hypothetical protein
MLTSEFFQQNKLLIIGVFILFVLIVGCLLLDRKNKEGFLFEATELYQPALKKNMTHFNNSVMLGLKDINEDYNRVFKLRDEVKKLEKEDKILKEFDTSIKSQIIDTNMLIIKAKDAEERKQKFYQILYTIFGLRDISSLYRAKFVCRDPERFDYCQDMNELTIRAKSATIIKNTKPTTDKMLLDFELYHQSCNKPVVIKKAPIDALGKLTDIKYLRPSLNVYNTLTEQNLIFPVDTTKILSYNDLYFSYSINTSEESFKLYSDDLSFVNDKTFINYDTPDIDIENLQPDSNNLSEIVKSFYKVELPIKLDMVYKFRNRTDMPTVYDIGELAHQEVITTKGTEYNLFVSGKNLLIKTIFNPKKVLTNEMINDFIGYKIVFPYICNLEGTVLKNMDQLEKVKRITNCEIKQKLSWTENEDAFSFVRTEKF